MSSVEVTEATANIPVRLASEWDRLADRAGAGPFVRPGWVMAWWRSFGRGSLEILQLRRDGELAGVLPLERRGRRLLSPTNAHTPSFGTVCADTAAARELMTEALRRPFAHISMTHLDGGASGLESFSAAASSTGRRATANLLARSPYIDTSSAPEDYEAALSAKLLREIRRRRRRLEAEGPITIDVADGTARLDELLAEGLVIEGAAWKAGAGTSIESRSETGDFYRAVAHWAASNGTLRLAFLRVSGRAIAFDFCLEDGGAHYLLKTGFDPAARELGPGAMMRWEMISRAFAEDLTSYEFLGREDPWKLRWTGTTRARMVADAFGPSPAGRAHRIWHTSLRPLAKRVLRRET